MENTKISKQLVLYYSLLAIALAIVGLPLYIYLPTFYATTVGIEIATVGLIIFIARLTDVFTDPYFGYLSDKSIEYFNSRKPIMILGSFILICSFYALINPNLQFPKLWLLAFSTLVYIGWSMINIPYLTWSSEISCKYEDKTLLNSSRELFTIIGVLIALLVPYIYEVSQNFEQTLQILYMSFLILFIPLFFITLKKIKIKTNIVVEKYTFKNLKNIYKNISDLKYLQIGYFFNNLANALPATLFLLFIELVIQEKSSGGMILILYFFSGIIALPFWNFLSSKIGKKKTWISSIVLASSAFVFVPLLQAGDLNAFIIISLVSGLSLGADMALPTSIQSDLVQRSKDYESNISGLLFGIWTMITKLSLAFAVALSFIILGFYNFEASNPTSTSLLVLAFLYGIFPVILKLIAIFFINKYTDKKA
ncbi:MFS transporter [Poseidonibacter lekithochrous]|uniref:MFS transporter n=1 Tax=Poseidonibacter TaxID=2321187 RepID=UPI001C08279F|nr:MULTISPECIES: MFS transporter [Poseidonibacter]MBU3013839.1 MFS transporter [Poseidonibacter lekithochrous]MDO6827135.1 MFS transporter [Poseidonibacter sp. 1_MG-2023]